MKKFLSKWEREINGSVFFNDYFQPATNWLSKRFRLFKALDEANDRLNFNFRGLPIIFVMMGPIIFVVLVMVLVRVCGTLSRQVGRVVSRDHISSTHESPPPNAEFLFYLFLDAQNCDAVVGDLEQRYRVIAAKFGQRRARFWYWSQAIRSVGPIAWGVGQKDRNEAYRRPRHMGCYEGAPKPRILDCNLHGMGSKD